jgi:serine protease Do
MNSFTKFGFAMLVAFLACSVALPFSYSQARVFSTIAPLNDSGAYLGIQMDDVNADNMSKYKLNSERGVIVRSVAKGSPAEKASLQENDVILEFGGFQVWSSLQFSRLVKETPIERKVELSISRDGKRMNLSAQLTEREGRRADNRIMEAPPGMEFEPGDRYFSYKRPYAPDENAVEPPAGKPRLGLTLQPLTDQLGEFLGVPGRKGALISSVAGGSPSSGKLKSGDVVIGADDTAINSPDELVQYVRGKAKGPIKLKIIRDKKEMAITVDLPEEGTQKGYKL